MIQYVVVCRVVRLVVRKRSEKEVDFKLEKVGFDKAKAKGLVDLAEEL